MSTYAEKYAIVLPLVIQGAQHYQIVQALALAGHLPSRGHTVYALMVKAERYLQRAGLVKAERYLQRAGLVDPLLK
jgi:hypothetical protein